MVGRIRRETLENWVDPADAFILLYSDADFAFWLDSGPGAATGVSYLGAASEGSRFATMSSAADAVRVQRVGEQADETLFSGDILDFLRAELRGDAATAIGRESQARAAARDDTVLDDSVSAPDSPARFALGWVGWLGYEFGARASRIPAEASDWPDAALLYVDRAIAFDHDRHTVTLMTLGADEPDAARTSETDRVRWLGATRRALCAHPGGDPAPAAIATTAREPAPGSTTTAPPHAAQTASVQAAASAMARSVRAHWRHDDPRYLRMIAECQRQITAGNAYQLCLTNEVRVAGAFDPLTTYLKLRAASPVHHGGFLRFGSISLLSASPEQFLTVSAAGTATTKPIKGTRPRGVTHSEDELLRADLIASEKEQAENVMIVDLMRNDLSRVSALGSVEVRELLSVESYAQVHQLVSTVSGRLAPGFDGLDAVRACFPAGSMTGAPKSSAMRILHSLEAGPRGVYSGCFGYVGLDGQVDLAMVIRSIVLDDRGASIGTGGGITSASVATEELAEMKLKAEVLLSVLAQQPNGS